MTLVASHQRSPNRIFAVNLWLNTLDYVSTHWPLLLLTTALLSVPKLSLLHSRYRFSLSQRLMTNADLLALCKPKDTVHVRVRIVSLSHTSIRLEHVPLFTKRQSSKGDQIASIDTDEIKDLHSDPPPYGILQVKLAGLETPLEKRAL